MRRWVLDTNVVVSALRFRGVTSRLHAAWRGGEIRLVVDRDILLGDLSRSGEDGARPQPAGPAEEERPGS